MIYFQLLFQLKFIRNEDNENGNENSLDDQSASNNTDLNALDTNATT